MSKIIELRRERAGYLEKAERLVDDADVESRGMTADERRRYDGYMRKVDRIDLDLAEAEAGEQRKADSIDVSRYMPSVLTRRTADRKDSIFCRYIRTGDGGAMRELRASNDTDMNITTDADGGYAVPTGHYQGIIAKARPSALYAEMGVWEIPGKGTTVNVPVDNESDDGAFVSTAEAAAYDRDAPELGQVQMTLVKYTKRIELSAELIEDEDSKLMEYLESYVGDGVAATLNNLMVTEALANGTAGLTLDSATAIGAAEIPELLYTLNAEYANGRSVAWLMKRETEGAIRSLSGNAFQFAPTPAGRIGARSEIFGVPVFTSSYVPSIGASAKSLVVADWSKMGVRFAPQMQMIRDPYSLAVNGKVRLTYMFRTVFKVLQAEAIQYATHPAS